MKFQIIPFYRILQNEWKKLSFPSLQHLLRYPLDVGEGQHVYILLEDVLDSVGFEEEGGVSVFDPGHLGEGGHIIS